MRSSALWLRAAAPCLGVLVAMFVVSAATAQMVDTGDLAQLDLLTWTVVSGAWSTSGTKASFDPKKQDALTGAGLPPGVGFLICQNARFLEGRVAVRVSFTGTPHTAQIVVGYNVRAHSYSGIGIDENRAIVIHRVSGKGSPPERQILQSAPLPKPAFHAKKDYTLDLSVRSARSAAGVPVTAYTLTVNDISFLNGEFEDSTAADTVGLIAKSDDVVEFKVLVLDSGQLHNK